MKYAREHIKRYWVFEYRRALGVSMTTFAIALSIGVVFTSLISVLSIPNPLYEMIFWGLLILFTAMVLVSSFVNAHMLSIKYMSEEEYKKHSKYIGSWLTILAIGVIAFALPVLFFNNMYEPIAILFGFGGVFWVMFLSVKFLFNYSYYEIAVGATALWLVALVALYGMLSAYPTSNAPTMGSFSLFISILSLVIITGFIGISLLVNASNEFSHEFKRIIEEMNRKAVAQTRRGRHAK